jgi:tetratricopeptide (TPR) repeat protein
VEKNGARNKEQGKNRLAAMLCAAAFALLSSGFVIAQETDWQSAVRAEVARKNLDGAAALVEQRLGADPGDLEARGWRARLLARNGRWAEAETEYRRVLEKAPADTEIMTGLAEVLVRQEKLQQALDALDRARNVPPVQAWVLIRRARLLARLNRPQEARAEYQAALGIDPYDREAGAGLAAMAGEHRHELRFGIDTDTFNYTGAAAAESVTLASHWDSRWTTTFSSTSYQRFGASAERMTARVSRRVGSNWFSVGGGGSHDETVIPRSEFALEYGRGFRLGSKGLVRGMEFSVSPQWFWYRNSRVMTITTTSLFYLPRDWMWTLTLVCARSSFPVAGVQWQPSGSTRLSFPLVSERLRGHVSFGVGTEDFAKTDEIGHFSARTFAAGLKYRISPVQDFGGYVAYQDRSQQRTQTSFGFTYGIRF